MIKHQIGFGRTYQQLGAEDTDRSDVVAQNSVGVVLGLGVFGKGIMTTMEVSAWSSIVVGLFSWWCLVAATIIKLDRNFGL